jgi:exodeoxyribonuclease-3
MNKLISTHGTTLVIATWNVNSIRARLPNVVSWLSQADPDIVLLQEIKCETTSFPSVVFEDLGYNLTVFGQKSYNGVAILSKYPIEDVKQGLLGDLADKQARYVEATIAGLRIASLYLPNGNPVGSDKFNYKLEWMNRLYKHVNNLLEAEQPFILGGDWNVIPSPEDCYDPPAWIGNAVFTLPVRQRFNAIIYLGLTEAFRALNPEASHVYTFWDYQQCCWETNRGLRIDHFLLSPQAADRLLACTVDYKPRSQPKPSDHVPVVVTLN